MVDEESTPAKDGTPESEEPQEAEEPTKKVLLVEDNNVNLKVEKPNHLLYQYLI